ncbi:hypothetical protein PWEIH_03706 [Listeria weihenstephanensis FSL R9-0317]|uniref:hypothetical protein n=1 Tax=Listeria weihenstephanensis TaxID=1006155 RepID=UPI0003E8A4C7|nr:hypothetical protein [Listeria weihenstephanensis]EUJ40500.1 hypothetical protein PWEIH_03706 [Listeria weihenstephanensis FSL R9-0317]
MKAKRTFKKVRASLLVATLTLSGAILTPLTANAEVSQETKDKVTNLVKDYYNSQITTVGEEAIFPDAQVEGVSDDAVLDNEGTEGEITTFGAAVMWQTKKNIQGYGIWSLENSRRAKSFTN